MDESYYVAVSDDRPERRSASEHVTWALEAAGNAAGWRDGTVIGSEKDLCRSLSVSRETLREAIRIMERRGCMTMKRGHAGGLAISSSSMDVLAVIIATQFRLTQCGLEQVDEAIAELAPLLPSDDPLLLPLCRHTRCLLAQNPEAGPFFLGEPVGISGRRSRASAIAAKILEHGMAMQVEVCLGSEWDLCEAYASSRKVVRQALRLLADCGVIESRRGRGGGIFLCRPSPLAVIRPFHPWLASRGIASNELLPHIWALNIAHLRIAARRMQAWNAAAREQWADNTARDIAHYSSDIRWVRLLQTIGKITDNLLLEVLIRSCVAYQARCELVADPDHDANRQVDALGMTMLAALREGDWIAAEAALVAAQDVIDAVAHRYDGVSAPDHPKIPGRSRPCSRAQASASS